MTRSRWIPIGRGLFCSAAVSRKPGEIILFARGATGELLYKEWQHDGWSECECMDFPVARSSASEDEEPIPVEWQVSACSSESGRIDLFARSPSGDLLHGTETQAGKIVFQLLGSPAKVTRGIAFPLGLAGPPVACSAGQKEIDVFALGQGGELLHVAYRDGHWSEFESLGIPAMHIAGTRAQPVPVSTTLSACRCGPDCMAVFIRSALGALLLKWWDGATWSEFASLGMPEARDETYPAVTAAAPLTGPPAVCSWGSRRMDVFVRGPAGDLLHKWWAGGKWSQFESLWMPASQNPKKRAIPFTGPVTTCTWGANRLDVFAEALDGNLYHAWWDGAWDHQ